MRLQTRVLFAIAYVLVVALVAFMVPLAINYAEQTDSEVRVQASGQGDLLAVTAAEDLREGPSQLGPLVDVAARTVRGRVLVVDRRGRAVADSGGTPRGTDYSNRPEIRSALAGRKVQLERHSASLDRDLFATAVPIVEETGDVLGAVRITQSVEAVDRAAERSVAGLIAIGGIVLLIGLAAGVFLARQIARPVRSLTESAERIAEGHLDERASPAGSAEQRTLAESFNRMTDRLEGTLDSQRGFIADASHQLRTPLTGVRLRIDEARAESESAAVDRELDAAAQDLDRLSRIVDDLLLLSRLGERETRPVDVDLVALAAAAVERWRPEATERGVQLKLDSRGPTPTRCPPGDAEHVLDALVENGLVHGAGGGELMVRVAPGRIDVLDRGPGLAPGEEERVFERFHRGSAGRGSPGTGLGLAIARGLADAWGGTVAVENRPGGGTRASVTFPQVRGAVS